MPFLISAELHYTVFQRSTILLNLHALATPSQSIAEESFTVTSEVACETFPLEIGENRYVRLDTCDVRDLSIYYNVRAETNPTVRRVQDIEGVSLAQVERRHVPYLFPSRYCQSDRLGRLAFKHFGHLIHPLVQAEAISNWIFENIDYVYGATDAGTSAYDTVTQRAGVCRDFAHLGIAFCRALSIPARYFAGYACNMQPQDFHACFEVCVGNEWFVFDPTRLASPNGLVRIATGRDAADAALATIFGAVQLESMQVECTAANFQPLSGDTLEGNVVQLDSV